MAGIPGIVQSVPFSAATAAQHDVVADATGAAIELIGLCLVADDPQVITIEDGDGTNRTGAMSVAAEGGFVWPPTGIPYLRTAVGQGLSILLGQAVQTSGVVIFRRIE